MATFLFSCNGNAQKNSSKESSKSYEVTKSQEEWKAELTSQEYAVLREAATERPYSSDLLDIKKPGIFVCAACGNKLYENEHKFESGTGWPSFDRAIDGGVAYGSDSKLGYQRDEVHCAKCGGHLGHVFNDGPKETTGKRHCINGVAMDFEPRK
ncbi:peptide-methionine (R)-S-oxide reductase MsrB [uncultured Christiangramia sp.]|uniref:peptide-methionine (R)-S-oxide reductase MsrB n=1 Tax=uncultured Christiangramia sp. TaxID=503836 RepID=UPI00262854A6|nr:peptide-methionine (R)-S-oxide reductase MsrB [uncultured Christiangramia sp.]